VQNNGDVTRLTLEVIVSTLDDAIEAARGGADRLEVVRDLSSGGLTPPIDVVRRIQAEVPLPLRVMVRESDGYSCRSDDERRLLLDAARTLDALEVDGIVIGWIAEGRVDQVTLAAVLGAAPSLRATFHRAFDALPDPVATFDTLRQYPQIDRVLTGAGTGTWKSRCSTLERYARASGDALIVLPGGGIDADALEALADCRFVTEAHIGRAARIESAVDGRVSAEAIRMLRSAASRRDDSRESRPGRLP
jgi:copper homeostasis protein